MKVVIFSAVAVLAVVGITLAQDFNNNFNNFNDDDEGRGFWGGSVGGISSGLSSGMSSWGGASWGGMSGGWGGAGVGAGVGTGFGSGMGGVSYVPLPARGGSGSSGILGALRE